MYTLTLNEEASLDAIMSSLLAGAAELVKLGNLSADDAFKATRLTLASMLGLMEGDKYIAALTFINGFWDRLDASEARQKAAESAGLN